jgi:hypothetical protein
VVDSWVALSDREEVLGGAAAGPILTTGTFILEFDLPLTGPTVLLDFQAIEAWSRVFSVFADEEAGIIVMHRQGSRMVRHVLPGPLKLCLDGTARIVFSWDGPAKSWTLQLEQSQTGTGARTRGRNPMPLLRDDLVALSVRSGRGVRHSSVLWYGAKLGQSPPTRAPWIGLQTPLQTAGGPVAAGYLREGDLLQTADGDLRPVLSLRRMDLPSRGTFSPILLRSPYFGVRTDLLVSSDQLIAMAGAEVEYLFNEEQVLAEAGRLTDGRAAMKSLRNAVTSCMSIDMGDPVLLVADGCHLLSHNHAGSLLRPEAPCRIIQGYEAIPLIAQLGRAFASNAA